MKKLLTTLILAICISTSAQAGNFKSYYDYATGLNSGLQISFSTSMVQNYTNANKTYNSLIDRFGHIFGHYTWFQGMIDRRDFHNAEIVKFQSLIDAKNQEVTLVGTRYKTSSGVIVTRGTPTLSDESTAIVEENNGVTIKEYAVVTKVFTTTIKNHHWKNIQTITDYSDGTYGVSNNSSTTKIENTTESETKIERELIREYAVLVIEDPIDDGIVILTEAEYLAREDVTLSGTDTFIQAVRNKHGQGISASYINDRLSVHYGNHLEQIGAPAAWSRGYTGEGSTIAILDTGIDVDHPEFADSILGTKCFVATCIRGNETIQDLNKYSHGTHVAGTAAANLDGVGTTGVAYDADLLIAKTAYDNGFFDFTLVDEAIAWSVANGADVINISANSKFDSTYRRSLVEISPGVYKSTDTRGRNGITFDKYGYNGVLNSEHYYKNIVTAMKGHDAVLVMAAGNQGTNVVGQPGMVALDNEVGNRVLIVGNWDNRLKDIAFGSNMAGTVCYDVAADGVTCNSDARISNRFLMAPGREVAATNNTGGYQTNNGTSMAAPMVSGAVAIVHQMWPHMTGANLSKLLLNTANKDFTAYDVNVHGQGLLDLDEATLPQGAIGLPTTGRADGGTVDVTNSGNIALSGGNISAFSEVMVIDDYDRDYYFNANSMVSVADTRTASPTLSAQHGFTPDYYIGYTGGHIVPTGNGSTFFSINSVTNNVSVTQKIDKFTLGLVTEDNSFLGNYANSQLMRVDGSNTAYLGYSDDFDFGNGVNLFGSATFGATKLSVDNTSMLKSADIMMSNSATLGMRQTVGTSTFGFVASMPVSITSGKANFNIASSVSAEGDIQSSDISSSMSTTNREIDFGLFYNYNPTKNSALALNVELRNNYAGTDTDQLHTGISYKVMF